MIEFKVSNPQGRDTLFMIFRPKHAESVGPENPRVPLSIGLLVVNRGTSIALCPFFGKCDGLLIVDRANGQNDFLQNDSQDSDALCNQIIRSGVKCVVCGFIGEKEKALLHSKGVDVRLGSCACSVEGLVANFDMLEEA